MRIVRITFIPMLSTKPKNSVVLMNDQGVPVPLLQAGSKSAADLRIPIVNSLALLGERGELKIEHNGEQYSLRRTRHGKLILTK